MSGNVHHATLESSRELAHQVIDYRFALEESDRDLRWRPGQFISLHAGQQADGTPILRSYSLANRPGEGSISLVVKLVAGGPASELLRTMPPGTRVRFTGPMGFFVLDLQHPGDVVLGATGTGIAPFLPMLDDLLDRDEPGAIHLYWGVRDERDLFWQDELRARIERSRGRLHATTLISGAVTSWSGERGRITPRIFELLPTLSRPTFYLCGNGAMIREVKAGLVERGVDRKRQIRVEAFFD